jgi:hypothetical protein
MQRIFRPLPADHPLVTDGDLCSICRKPFCEGERTTLAAARVPQQGVETVPAVVLHATCAFEGAKTPVGEIERIRDGDASPFPVLTTDGKQHTLAEAGLSE